MVNSIDYVELTALDDQELRLHQLQLFADIATIKGQMSRYEADGYYENGHGGLSIEASENWYKRVQRALRAKQSRLAKVAVEFQRRKPEKEAKRVSIDHTRDQLFVNAAKAILTEQVYQTVWDAVPIREDYENV